MHSERQTFTKEERLKSRKLIGNLFDNGQIIHNYPFKVIFKLTDDKNFIYPAKIALSVSKRNFKRAVARNYIKRKIREAYRKNKIELYTALTKNDQKLYFFVIYTAKQDMDYVDLETAMKSLLIKLIEKTKVLLND